MTNLCRIAAASMLLLTLNCTELLWAELPQKGDVILGVNGAPPMPTTNSLDLVRGPANGMGTSLTNPWDLDPFVTSVAFDNLNGMPHNAQGNLLGASFGPSGGSGLIYSFSTTDETVHAGQLIGDTMGLGGSVTLNRLAGLSVSPDNSKIAVMGYSAGSVIVYDYAAGDTKGAGAALSGARETTPQTLVQTDTQSTAWIDSNTVVSLSTFGSLFEVNATTMAASQVATVPTPIGPSMNTYVLYEPSISPYLYANWNDFDSSSSTTTNFLYVLDPANGYSVEHTVNLSGSAATMREMAFDADGNLYLLQFGSAVDVILGAAGSPLTIADDSSVDWYTSGQFTSFPGMDVALSGAGDPPVSGDFNMDGVYDCLDIDALTGDIAAGSNTPLYDLTGDGLVNDEDLAAWLVEGGEANLGPGLAYLEGDATLDGGVDVGDFNRWNENKFTTNSAWCSGDFNADGSVDVSDFNTWNGNKFTSSGGTAAVPEPAGLMLILAAAVMMVSRYRGR